MSNASMQRLIDLATAARRTPAQSGQTGNSVVAHPTGIERLGVITSHATTALDSTLYHPVVCLILQGAKEVELGTERNVCVAGQYIVVSHEVPVRSQITVASNDEPYVALILDLDITLLRRLVDDIDGLIEVEPDSPDHPSAGLDVGAADHDVIDAFRRLLELQHTPAHVPVVAPLIVHELHFRLLVAEHGGVLRRLLSRESHASRIAKAIAQIRATLDEPLTVPSLAKTAGMSVSSFHEHFKAVTATTPLRYQKELRLLEARQLLVAGDRTVTEVAFAVGYQSPTQFSREYSRKFGSPPSAAASHTVGAA